MNLLNWVNKLLEWNQGTAKGPPTTDKLEATVLNFLELQIAWQTTFDFSANKDEVKRTRLVEDIGMDSLDLTELLLDVESNYNITIKDEAVVTVRTVGDALNLVVATLNQSNNKEGQV